MCDLKFSEKNILETHYKTVHNKEKNYACNICGTRMANYCNLNDHRLKVHKANKMSIGEYRKLIKENGHPFVKPEQI